MNSEQIQNQLQDYYRRMLPGHQGAHVSDLVPMNEGWESIIYAFKLVPDPKTGDQPQNLILRIYPGMNAVQKSQREYEGMQVLYQVGYPVPKVLHLEREYSPFDGGRPFLLMERIPGEMMWPLLDRAQPEQVAVLITQFCELFVQLHALDWRAFVPVAEQYAYQDPFIFIDRFLNMLRGEMVHFPDLKAFSPVLDWLEGGRDQVPCARPAPVHWDFHPANVILKPDGAAVVIDWTQIQVSDPRFDLGWTLLLVGAYAGENLREMILVEYQQISGELIEGLAWFDVANCLKRLGSVMLSLSAGADSMGMRPDAVDMMRRDFPALRRMYGLLVDRSGIRVSAVERLLDS
jgi:aminoglycoside phosphotransferase (APT) family kinase protein